MTIPYVAPADVHNPTTGAPVPSAWGDAVNNAVAFLARPPGVVAQRTSSQSIPNAELTPVAFTAPDLRDTDDFHDPASNPQDFTIPDGMSGWYDWNYEVRWGSSSAASRNIYLVINGVRQVIEIDLHGVANAYPQFGGGKRFFTAGDVIQLEVYQATGGTVPVNSAQFSLFLVSL